MALSGRPLSGRQKRRREEFEEEGTEEYISPKRQRTSSTEDILTGVQPMADDEMIIETLTEPSAAVPRKRKKTTRKPSIKTKLKRKLRDKKKKLKLQQRSITKQIKSIDRDINSLTIKRAT